MLPSGDVLVPGSPPAMSMSRHDAADGTSRMLGPVQYQAVDPTNKAAHGQFRVPDAAVWTKVSHDGHGNKSESGKYIWRLSIRPVTTTPDGRHGVVAEGSTMRLVDLATGDVSAIDLGDVSGYTRPAGVREWQPVGLRDGRLTLMGRSAHGGYVARLTIDVTTQRAVGMTRLDYPAGSLVPTQVAG